MKLVDLLVGRRQKHEFARMPTTDSLGPIPEPPDISQALREALQEAIATSKFHPEIEEAARKWSAGISPESPLEVAVADILNSTLSRMVRRYRRLYYETGLADIYRENAKWWAREEAIDMLRKLEPTQPSLSSRILRMLAEHRMYDRLPSEAWNEVYSWILSDASNTMSDSELEHLVEDHLDTAIGYYEIKQEPP